MHIDLGPKLVSNSGGYAGIIGKHTTLSGLHSFLLQMQQIKLQLLPVSHYRPHIRTHAGHVQRV